MVCTRKGNYCITTNVTFMKLLCTETMPLHKIIEIHYTQQKNLILGRVFYCTQFFTILNKCVPNKQHQKHILVIVKNAVPLLDKNYPLIELSTDVCMSSMGTLLLFFIANVKNSLWGLNSVWFVILLPCKLTLLPSFHLHSILTCAPFRKASNYYRAKVYLDKSSMLTMWYSNSDKVWIKDHTRF